MLALHRASAAVPLLLVLPALLAGPPASRPAAAARPGFDDTRLIAEFKALVDEYIVLHRQLERGVSTRQMSADVGEIQAAITALRQRIRAERPRAKQGDLFTPAVATFFRMSIRQCLAGRSVSELLARLEAERYEEPDVRPVPLPGPRVNGTYPESARLPMMPPALLCSLPELPEELQYRLVGRDLVLWDHHADMVVDVLPKALPPPES